MELSKNVRPGNVLTLRGNKLIRAGKRTRKIIGVWQNADRKVFLNLDGTKTEIKTPTAVQIYGVSTINISTKGGDIMPCGGKKKKGKRGK